MNYRKLLGVKLKLSNHPRKLFYLDFVMSNFQNVAEPAILYKKLSMCNEYSCIGLHSKNSRLRFDPEKLVSKGARPILGSDLYPESRSD